MKVIYFKSRFLFLRCKQIQLAFKAQGCGTGSGREIGSRNVTFNGTTKTWKKWNLNIPLVCFFTYALHCMNELLCFSVCSCPNTSRVFLKQLIQLAIITLQIKLTGYHAATGQS